MSDEKKCPGKIFQISQDLQIQWDQNSQLVQYSGDEFSLFVECSLIQAMS